MNDSKIITRDNPEAGVTPFNNDLLDTIAAFPLYIPEGAEKYEIAGRKLMELNDMSTDEQDREVPQNHPTIAEAMVRTPMWALAAQEVIAFSQRFIAMQYQAHAMKAAASVANES